MALLALLPLATTLSPMPVSAQLSVPPGLACTPASSGLIVCTAKVPSWDGIPLDVDVTLPAGPVRPRPLIVMLHGYANQKTEWESSSAGSSNPDKDHYNSAWFASRGYTVLTYTARGFHGSCGQGPLTDPRCARGWTHLADRRFEIRDTQYLAGLLADMGVADPQRIAATGGSYGGGQSLLLAMQGDRIAAVPNPNNPATYDRASLRPWSSPIRHLPMHLAAVVPKYPWSDLIDSLVPNGRASDGVILPDGDRLHPVGIEKQSYVSYLYESGNAPNGYYCPQPCLDQSANLTAWFVRVSAGEPYLAQDPLLNSALEQLKTWKSAFYQDALINRTTDQVPIFDIQGWTDNLFPEVEGVSLVNKLRTHGWPVKVEVADVGHPIAQNQPAVWSRLNAEANAFLDHYLMGGAATLLDSTVQVTSCGGSPGATFNGGEWAGLAPHRRTFSDATSQATTFVVGDQPAGALTDPIAIAAAHGGNGACVILPPGSIMPGSAGWEFAVSQPFTLLGEPALHLQLTLVGVDAEVNTRLWDIAPDGSRTLITRGAFRISSLPGAMAIDTALQGNGWDFLAGHTIRLEVTQNDAPYLRLDNLASSIVYDSMTLTLPTPTS
jgi:predicted acyl esterase